jgi:membrane protein DedA with SNARE-associated domain/rhodanese-related sulfurtransferase
METSTSQFLINYGLPLVFGAVLVEQMGLPLPAFPWLLGAGALSAAGKFSLPLGLGVTVIACLIADGFWFYLGRYRGNQVLGLLCRISLEPDSCVRRTQNLFTRYGLRGVLVAKFVPGLNTVAPPLAGMSGISANRFLFVDALGSLLYGSCLLLVGYLFSDQIEQIAMALASIGGRALSLLAILLVGYIGVKFWQRQRVLRELSMARITVEELRRKQESGEQVVIVDLRSHVELSYDPSLISGAVHLALDEIEKNQHKLPRDREIIVYCSCPNEESSARVARLLHRKGFTRVRPLKGGLDAWRAKNYPVQNRVTVPANDKENSTDSEAMPLKAAPNPILIVENAQNAKRPQR